MTQLNTEKLKAVVNSIASEAANHPEHGEEDLCSACRIKRQVWDLQEFQIIAENLANDARRMALHKVFTREFDYRIEYTFMEAIVMGMEIMLAYKEAEELEKQDG